jgi:DNA-binding transcriptional LysR family regulator
MFTGLIQGSLGLDRGTTLPTDFSDDRLQFLYHSFRLGTMRAASEHLGVAASSISRQVAGLERDLGIELIERGRHTVKLTEAGLLAIEYYRDRASRREALVAALDELRGVRKGALTLAVGEGFIGTILLSSVQEFARTYSGVRLSVQLAATHVVLSMIEDDAAHFGVVFDPPQDPKIRIKLSVPQPIRLMVRPDHPLARRTVIQLRDVLTYPLVLLEPTFRIRQLLAGVERTEDIHLDPIVTTSSLILIKDLVLNGTGITLVNEILFSDELEKGSLVAIPLDHESLNTAAAHVITRLGRQLPPAAVALLRILEGHTQRWRKTHIGSVAGAPRPASV